MTTSDKTKRDEAIVDLGAVLRRMAGLIEINDLQPQELGKHLPDDLKKLVMSGLTHLAGTIAGYHHNLLDEEEALAAVDKL
jgi:hypothetical protein